MSFGGISSLHRNMGQTHASGFFDKRATLRSTAKDFAKRINVINNT